MHIAIVFIAITTITCTSHCTDAFVPIARKHRLYQNNAHKIAIRQSLGNSKNNENHKVSSIIVHNMNASKDNNEINQYLDKASKLRKEAKELEAQMKSRKGGNDSLKSSAAKITTNYDTGNEESSTNKNVSTKSKSAMFTLLENSTWIISYRFSSDPVSKENDDVKPIFYSGKVAIRLKGDGYTELIPLETTDNSQLSLLFLKFWGWDEEISREDGEKYLSFSADVVLPISDPNYDKGSSSSRFYFNSQVESDSKTGEISLKDGTITVKRDIEPPGGFWGVFNAGGILAQFRYCGDFLIKPFKYY